MLRVNSVIKILILLLGSGSLISCSSSRDTTYSVDKFSDVAGKQCFFIKGTYAVTPADGIYCKIDLK